jgi:xanthine dehydrogenase YagR molybdenum-binding subunit
MNCLVNGRAIVATPHDDDTAIDLLRDSLGLTGTKLACGAGTCGACTVLADDVPVCACLLPAAALDGRRVTTIEAFGDGHHPIQRAFMHEDALQCGYCTAGFIMQGIAFFDAWRTNEGRTTPTDAAIAEACAGHLCRCGAYPQIARAIARACAGDYDTAPTEPPARYDAALKTTGRAQYSVDVRLPDQLEGKIVRSPFAHADITAIDLSAAAAMDGVFAAVDLTGGAARVRYIGQEIAAVAARDRHTAERAAERVAVSFDRHPAAIGLDAASKPGAPRVYASVFEHMDSESELPLVPTLWRDNVRGPSLLMSRHPIRAKLALASPEPDTETVVWRGRSSAQSHTPLEPHACVAHWTSDDTLEVYVSTQACADLAMDIADRWSLPRDRVRVRCDFIGGAFGAKADLTMEVVAAVELSRAAHRPVRVVLTNAEELVAGGYRPAVEIDLTLLAKPTGAIDAVDMATRTDGGVAIGSAAAGVARLAYPNVPKWLADYDVVSHTPPAKPFRGPGGPAAFWGLEQAIDILAHRRGVDPVAIRRANDTDPRMTALLDWVETIPAWRDRDETRRDDRILRGIGLATGAWTAFVHSHTSVTVSAGRDGIVVSCASQDIGTGSRTVLAGVVARVFNVAASQVDVRIGDSRFVRASMSSGSRTTVSVAPAADAAAREVRDRLGVAAAQRLGLAHPVIDERGVSDGAQLIAWPQLLAETDAVEVTMKRPRDPGGYELPMAMDGFLLGEARPISAHVCEVDVDRRTGRVRVPRVWTGLAVGRVYAPTLARSQAIGGVVQGVSYALYEERRIDPVTGRTVTQCLDDHRLCGLADAPEIDVHFVAGDFESIAGGGVGLGEISTIAVASAIGNAVFDATGWRPADLPLRIERVLAALNALAESGR